MKNKDIKVISLHLSWWVDVKTFGNYSESN